ncbi:hypothetical protein Airi01_088860 [Actinoallomurus iriomotensis]|uniref:Uncharacterized protein n=2 Tax=Actinoallomurus iriomotensis TaxID=478107 RepID=A0A9W6VUX5_9ACTN|nr:hypothetical protein Airi01_088860 [Actinoallomurus iriomotensis]
MGGMAMSEPLGAATAARHRFCRPDEQLLWAAYRRVFYFDLLGHDPYGKPRKSLLRRGAEGFGGFLLDGVEVMLGDDEGGESGDRPPPPDLIVFGPAPGCLAHRAATEFGTPGTSGRRLWALTAHRLGVLAVAPPPDPPKKKENRSLARRAAGFGKGLVETGRDIGRILADSRERYGDNIEGEPLALPEWSPVQEFARERIVSVGPDTRAQGRRTVPCLRVVLADGSGLDFLLPTADPAMVEHLAVLVSGR